MSTVAATTRKAKKRKVTFAEPATVLSSSSLSESSSASEVSLSSSSSSSSSTPSLQPLPQSPSESTSPPSPSTPHTSQQLITKTVKFDIWSSMIGKFYGRDTANCCFVFDDKLPDKIKEIEAHREVLCALSQTFSDIFDGECDEKWQLIRIDDTTAETFQLFLAYFYEGQVHLSSENIHDMFYLAHKYAVVELMSSCAKFAMELLNGDNVVQFYSIGICYDLEELQEKCVEIISKCTESVFKTSAFHSSDHITLEKILQVNQMSCEEHVVFDACIEWAKEKCKQMQVCNTLPENLRSILGECFTLIRFKEMNRDEFGKRYELFKAMFKKNETDDIFMDFMHRKCGEMSIRYVAPIALEQIHFDLPQVFAHVHGKYYTASTGFMVTHPLLLASITFSVPDFFGAHDRSGLSVVIHVQRMNDTIFTYNTKTPNEDFFTVEFSGMIRINPCLMHTILILVDVATNCRLAQQINHTFERCKWNSIQLIPMNSDDTEARSGLLTIISRFYFQKPNN